MEHKLIYKIKDDVVLNNIPSNSELLGQAKILSEGNDITIVSYSNMVNVVKDAISSDELSEISAELIDLQTLSPLDMQTIITSVSKTKKLLVNYFLLVLCNVLVKYVNNCQPLLD